MELPLSWPAEDGQLYLRVGRHVQAALANGKLPAVAAPGGDGTRLLAPLHRLLLDERTVAGEAFRLARIAVRR